MKMQLNQLKGLKPRKTAATTLTSATRSPISSDITTTRVVSPCNLDFGGYRRGTIDFNTFLATPIAPRLPETPKTMHHINSSLLDTFEKRGKIERAFNKAPPF